VALCLQQSRSRTRGCQPGRSAELLKHHQNNRHPEEGFGRADQPMPPRAMRDFHQVQLKANPWPAGSLPLASHRWTASQAVWAHRPLAMCEGGQLGRVQESAIQRPDEQRPAGRRDVAPGLSRLKLT
jgi:hypothetical protein